MEQNKNQTTTQPKDTLPKDTLPKDTLPKDTLPKDTPPKDTPPKDTPPKDTPPKYSLRKPSLKRRTRFDVNLWHNNTNDDNYLSPYEPSPGNNITITPNHTIKESPKSPSSRNKNRN